MKLFQYLILTILIANGSLPIVKDMVNATGNQLLIEFFGQTDTADDCVDTESEGDDASDDNLVSPENHVNYEPKPYDSTSESSTSGVSKTSTVKPQMLVHSTAAWVITDEYKLPHLSTKLLRHTHFSKRSEDLS